MKMAERCLSKAADRNFTSIAFPAFDTGLLSYDVRDVYTALIDAVKSHQCTHVLSSIREVFIVVYDKDSTKEQVTPLIQSNLYSVVATYFVNNVEYNLASFLNSCSPVSVSLFEGFP